MHSTRHIERVALPALTRMRFRCHPLRGDSLSLDSVLYDRKVAGGRRRLCVAATRRRRSSASGSVLPPCAPARRPSPSPHRRDGRRSLPLPSRARGALRLPFSEFFDWNDPPLLKSCLHVDATPERVSVRCFATTGSRSRG
jgi:hypothetical protein